MNFSHRSTLSAALMIAAASGAWAQDVCTDGANEASFDFISLDCVQCTVHPSARDFWIEYGAEPMIRAVTRMDVQVQPGDVVVAVDGILITTPAGGHRFARPQAGHAARFTIRRGGRQMYVILTPTAQCENAQTLSEGQNRLNRAPVLWDSVRGLGNVRQFRNGTMFWTTDSTGKAASLRGQLSDNLTRALANARGGRMMANDSAGVGSGMGRGVGVGILRSGEGMSGHLSIQVDSSGGGSVRRIVVWRNDSGRILRGDTIYLTGRVGQRLTGRIGAIGGGRGGAAGSASRGWLGFGLDCSDCASNQDSDGQRVWHFGAPPVIAGIDPGGPAELAGVLAGDLLRAIDGLTITSSEGSARFNSLKSGQRVRLTVERRGHTVEIVMTAGPRTN